MTYVALTHIGGKYTPGEIIREELPADKLAWLLKAGAIRAEDCGREEPREDATNACTCAEPENAPTDGAELYETDDEAEIPEIDVMDGIVPAEEPRKTARKSGGKKR